MKNRNFWQLVRNPFTRVAGWQAFLLGILIVLLSAAFGKYANLLFDGAIDAHYYNKDLTLVHALCVSVVDVVSIFVVMTIGAFILTKKFRVIDILGTMTLARAPFLLLAILALFVHQPEYSQIMTNPMVIFTYPMFLVFTLFSLPVLVWVIALTYNAFKVSTGMSGGKLIATFIGSLIVAEIISKVLIMLICS